MTPNPKVPPKTPLKTEAEWEEDVLTETLDDALDADGHLDFDKLRSTGITLTLDELHTEDDDTDES